MLGETTTLKGKFYTGVMPSERLTVTVNVPESLAVGDIVKVAPSHVTNPG